ncbi:hypothetical protein HOU00_gp282 [Caulobacter phage CcrPW]|uniref:Uncharacterized protein n=1 Tax=Caulobacter phage CcrPW TaxID=2283271 RepID=A0A385EAM8_9CAUD|nr:hypothetical protein HOU00_gp282 [Caulobacter phage CcrPW]AXQ68843.1 hypothetical protein CcrPW_gp304c [Caulobacter phage CcrPW]
MDERHTGLLGSELCSACGGGYPAAFAALLLGEACPEALDPTTHLLATGFSGLLVSQSLDLRAFVGPFAAGLGCFSSRRCSFFGRTVVQGRRALTSECATLFGREFCDAVVAAFPRSCEAFFGAIIDAFDRWRRVRFANLGDRGRHLRLADLSDRRRRDFRRFGQRARRLDQPRAEHGVGL